jgi:MFS family permease
MGAGGPSARCALVRSDSISSASTKAAWVAAAFSFVTLCSTTLQLHSAPAYRGRIMALWMFVYMGTTSIGSIITGAISSAGGPRVALLTGAAACLVATKTATRTDDAIDDVISARHGHHWIHE